MLTFAVDFREIRSVVRCQRTLGGLRFDLIVLILQVLERARWRVRVAAASKARALARRQRFLDVCRAVHLLGLVLILQVSKGSRWQRRETRARVNIRAIEELIRMVLLIDDGPSDCNERNVAQMMCDLRSSRDAVDLRLD